MEIIAAHSPEHLPAIRGLFTEYASTLGTNVCLRDFDRELAELPGRYAPPEGRLLLTLEAGEAAGCAAFRKLADGVCEMKRLYVRPAFRGKGLGRALAETLIRAARDAGSHRALRIAGVPSPATFRRLCP